MAKLTENYRMKITPLTPLHIGSGDEMNPGDYFILNDDSGRPMLYAMDVGRLSGRLTPQGRAWLSQLIETNPIGWVADILDRQPIVQLIRQSFAFRADMTDRVAGNIAARWGKRDSMLSIQLLQRSVIGPIVPGSSIKGALRTAMLWSRIANPLEPLENPSDRNVSEWERWELAAPSPQMQDDPLRHLKVTDSDPVEEATWVYDTIFDGMRSDTGQEAELQDYRECFPDTLETAAYSISARLSIASGHPHYLKHGTGITARGIVESCRSFYTEALKAEIAHWDRKTDGYDDVLAVCNEILHRAEQSPESGLIRLGWGSGLHSVSMNMAKPDGYHPPRRIDPRFRKDPVTRRLLDGVPPGWALFTLEEE